MSERVLKVTDRRMFTPDGELREEYRDLEETATPAVDSGPVETPPQASPAPEPVSQHSTAPPAAPPAEQTPAPEGEAGKPGFQDLIGLLAEPAMIYMREAHGADPQTASQSLELARLHIDLLGTLKSKTSGNLSPGEAAMLDDVIFQLRSGYVGLGG